MTRNPGTINPVNYAFGMVMPGRNGNSNLYRGGYQGSEKDDEVKGLGNSYTTQFRFLDPRLGRWLSIDPVVKPHESPYVSMGNTPIWHNDPLGNTDDKLTVDDAGFIKKVEKAPGAHTVYNMKGEQLKLNDPSLDNPQVNERKTVGDRLFVPVSNAELATIYNSKHIGKHYKRLNNVTTISFSEMPAIGIAGFRYGYSAGLGRGDFDFLMDMVDVSTKGGMYPEDKGFAIFRPRVNYDGSGGFIKFQNSNVLYNVHDAGNFMTGNAFKLVGISGREVRFGAQLNEGFKDSASDQRAIQAGSSYKGVVLKVPKTEPFFKF